VSSQLWLHTGLGETRLPQAVSPQPGCQQAGPGTLLPGRWHQVLPASGV